MSHPPDLTAGLLRALVALERIAPAVERIARALEHQTYGTTREEVDFAIDTNLRDQRERQRERERELAPRDD